MKKPWIAVTMILPIAFALPAHGKTYKYSYFVPCTQMWDAVKDTLNNADEYAQVQIDDSHLTAVYQPKHSVHFDVSGTLLQRLNHVTMITKDAGCEMQIVSNWSGWGHEDQGDFKKRVDEAMAKSKHEPKAQAAKPAGTGS